MPYEGLQCVADARDVKYKDKMGSRRIPLGGKQSTESGMRFACLKDEATNVLRIERRLALVLCSGGSRVVKVEHSVSCRQPQDEIVVFDPRE